MWMPAHQGAAAIDVKMKSNGHPINRIDWRANRLVDGLAKLSASANATPREQMKLIESAEYLTKHMAAQLSVSQAGEATEAASPVE